MENHTPDDVKDLAYQAGFTEEFFPKNAPILERDTATIRTFVHLTGGRGAHYMGLPARVGGPQTVQSLLGRSAMEQWNRDHKEEWTLLRRTDNGYQFVDHHVGQGQTRFTAGTFPEESRYPDKVISPGKHLEAMTGLSLDENRNWKGYELNLEDKMALTLRDYRWKNFSTTKRKLDGCMFSMGVFQASILGAAVSAMSYKFIADAVNIIPQPTPDNFGAAAVVGGIVAAGAFIYSITRSFKDRPATELNLNDLLFNEDVVKYLDISQQV